MNRFVNTFKVEIDPTKGTESQYGLDVVAAFGLVRNFQGVAKHVYGGTVDPAVTAKRRAANRVARASRRINRVRAA